MIRGQCISQSRSFLPSLLFRFRPENVFCSADVDGFASTEIVNSIHSVKLISLMRAE